MSPTFPPPPSSADVSAALTMVTTALTEHTDRCLRRFAAVASGDRLRLFVDELGRTYMAAGLVDAYARLYATVHARSRQELHDRMKMVVRRGGNQEVEDYFAAEQSWDQALRLVDDLLHDDMFHFGDRCPLQLFCSVAMQSLSSNRGEKTSVGSLFSDRRNLLTLFVVGNEFHLAANRRYIKQLRDSRLKTNGCQLYLVCSSRRSAEAAQRLWPTLDVLVDDNQELIRSMEFRISIWNACHTVKLHSLALAVTSQSDTSDAPFELQPLADGSPLEVYQLGGVVLVESSGWLRFYRKACSSVDWPSIDELLAHVPHDRDTLLVTNLEQSSAVVASRAAMLTMVKKREEAASLMDDDGDDDASIYSLATDGGRPPPTPTNDNFVFGSDVSELRSRAPSVAERSVQTVSRSCNLL